VGYSSAKRLLLKILRQPGFWFILILLVLITIVHYREAIDLPALLTRLYDNLNLSRHSLERILYLAPIVWAGFLFGWKGASITSLVAFVCMLPRAIFFSPYPIDALLETAAIFVIGNTLAVGFDALRKEREYRTQLEVAQHELQDNIRIIQENEKRLAALNQMASTVSQSLELGQVLSSAIDSVGEVIQVDIVLIFLLDEKAGYLTLAAHRGISEEFAQSVDRIKVGEGFNGRVVETGEPLFVEDASQDPRLTRKVVSQHQLRSELIVPLRAKGKVNGTLCVAMRSYHQFQPEVLELLTAIGNQIGVAVDNAHLYQWQQEFAEELRISEERYRELFENAHDAIWLHDLEGNIIAANRAAEKLTGYSVKELTKKNVRSFLSKENLELAGQIRRRLLDAEPVEQPYEQQLIGKDGGESFIQLATSLVFSNGKPVGFQHIARDVTQEKRMQENLNFYLQQASRAQEEERKRISRELHDDTIQALVALSRQLDSLIAGDKEMSTETRRRLDELWQQTNNIAQGVRRLSQDLRPAALDRLGLLSALEWLASDVAQYSGIETKVNVAGTERRFSEEVELVLFRIVQEALRNVWRHSKATKAEVKVVFDEGKTSITVSDNGKGFKLPPTIGELARYGKLGLAGMQERARLIDGSLSVNSKPGKGCTVTVEVPI